MLCACGQQVLLHSSRVRETWHLARLDQLNQPSKQLKRCCESLPAKAGSSWAEQQQETSASLLLTCASGTSMAKAPVHSVRPVVYPMQRVV